MEDKNYIIKIQNLESFKNHDTCPICLEKFQYQELLKMLTCLHFFHKFCLKKIKNKKCPLCRKFFK